MTLQEWVDRLKDGGSEPRLLGLVFADGRLQARIQTSEEMMPEMKDVPRDVQVTGRELRALLIG